MEIKTEPKKRSVRRKIRRKKSPKIGYFKPAKESELTILARVKEFSKIQLQTPVDEVRVDYSRSEKHFYKFKFTVYPHGHGSTAQGFVSIVFTRNFPKSYPYELTSVISVIDDEGSERFPQSFVVSSQSLLDEKQEEFVIDKYVSRSVLLKDDQLLPDDTLTLKVDFRCVIRKLLYGDFQVKNGSVHLKLRSYLATRLAKECPYFERLRVTPMKERNSSRVSIPGDEHWSLRKIKNMLFIDGPISFESIDEIFDLYVTADKYDIGIVTDNCRSWLVSCLTRENAAEILEFAESYGYDRLREEVKLFMRRIENGSVPDEGVPSNPTGTSERSRPAEAEDSSNETLKFQPENEKKERDEYNFYF